MVTRVATDERPFETPSSDESGLGRSDSPSENTEPEAALAVPPDGGWGWVVVFASFVCNVLVDGIITTSSDIYEKIKEDFGITESQKIMWLHSLLAGFYLLAGPFVSALANKYGFRIVTIVGSFMASACFGLCFFAPNLEYLYVVYGILGGIGLCMIYMPAVLIVGFYFEKWRAVATGIALCGSGVGVFVLKPVNKLLLEVLGSWRWTLVAQGGMLLLCTLLGATFRPIKPVRVTLADQEEEDDINRRHEEAVEKLNSMLKLHSKLDSGISMPPEMRFTNKVSPHTWMGVASNTRYPTAEEVFRGSNSHLSNSHVRRSSATAGAIKNTLGNKPMFIEMPVAEKDEDDSNSNIDNTEPLIGTGLKVQMSAPQQNHQRTYRRSHADLVARPLYRDDIFFGGSLARLPQYTSRTSLGYHLAVTHVPTTEDAEEEKSGKCRLCPEAVRRVLATMLDVNLFKSPTFLILTLNGFFTMLGFYAPFMYIGDRAKIQGWSESKRELLIATIGIANTVGRILCGMTSSIPKVSPLWVYNISLTAGGLAIALSGFNFADYYQFAVCILFGLAIACFSTLRSILAVEYMGLEQLTNCFGLFLLFQGIGALFGEPIVGFLYDQAQDYDICFYVAGGFLVASALICFPIDRINKWEKARSKTNTSPKV